MKRSMARRNTEKEFALRTARFGMRLFVAVFVSTSSMLTGCDTGRRSDTAHVQGTVTIGGEPLPDDAQANITFVPATKGRSAGAAVTNGKYDCPDAPLGKVKAYISVDASNRQNDHRVR